MVELGPVLKVGGVVHGDGTVSPPLESEHMFD